MDPAFKEILVTTASIMKEPTDIWSSRPCFGIHNDRGNKKCYLSMYLYNNINNKINNKLCIEWLL